MNELKVLKAMKKINKYCIKTRCKNCSFKNDEDFCLFSLSCPIDWDCKVAEANIEQKYQDIWAGEGD